MKILGSIISTRKIKISCDFVEVVKSLDDVSDPTKPILYVGLKTAKINNQNFSILNKRISENVYWTFGKNEKRDDYEKDIKNFFKIVLLHEIKQIKYYYLNLLKLSFSNIKRIVSFCLNTDIKYIFIDTKMIYIYYNNNIYGISLEILEWLNISIKKVIKKLKQNDNNRIFFNYFNNDSIIQNIINKKKYLTAYLIALNE